MGLWWLAWDSGYIHSAPPPGEQLTPCCNLGLAELAEGDKVSDVAEEVTCPVSWQGRPPDRTSATSMLKAPEGSFERLLKVRARIVRASSSEINLALREELLRIIDEVEK